MDIYSYVFVTKNAKIILRLFNIYIFRVLDNDTVPSLFSRSKTLDWLNNEAHVKSLKNLYYFFNQDRITYYFSLLTALVIIILKIEFKLVRGRFFVFINTKLYKYCLHTPYNTVQYFLSKKLS